MYLSADLLSRIILSVIDPSVLSDLLWSSPDFLFLLFQSVHFLVTVSLCGGQNSLRKQVS